MFGGYSDSGGYYGDTWIWRDSNWSRAVTASAPAGRRDAVLAEEPGRGSLVLFGGESTGVVRRSDTWRWDGATWVALSPTTSPSPRAGHAAFADGVSGRVVMFGGSASPTGPWFNDTWIWDGADWSQAAGGPAPPARDGAAIAFDSSRGRAVLFSGQSSGYLSDTWEWNGTGWIPMSPATVPPARSGAACAFVPSRGTVVMSGGISTGLVVLGDCWEWDGQDWRPLQTSAAPGPRYGASMAIDSVPWVTVLFGGRTAFPGGRFHDETWSLAALDGSYSTYRPSCAGSAGVPSLTASGPPRVGQMFRLQVSGIPVFSPGGLYFALDDRWVGGNPNLPLPVDLGFLGAAGCYANVDVAGPGTVTPLLIASALGVAALQFVIPLEARILGFEFFNQFVSIDPLAPRGLGIATTNAGRGVVGL